MTVSFIAAQRGEPPGVAGACVMRKMQPVARRGTSRTAAGRDTRPRRRPRHRAERWPGPRRVRATGTTIAGWGGVPARAFRTTLPRTRRAPRDSRMPVGRWRQTVIYRTVVLFYARETACY